MPLAVWDVLEPLAANVYFAPEVHGALDARQQGAVASRRLPHRGVDHGGSRRVGRR